MLTNSRDNHRHILSILAIGSIFIILSILAYACIISKGIPWFLRAGLHSPRQQLRGTLHSVVLGGHELMGFESGMAELAICRVKMTVVSSTESINLHGSSGKPLAHACKRVRFSVAPQRNINMQPLVEPKVGGFKKTAYEYSPTSTRAFTYTYTFTQLSYHYTPYPLKYDFACARHICTCICKQPWASKPV